MIEHAGIESTAPDHGASDRGTPVPGPKGYPLLGILPDLMRRPLDYCQELAETHGGLVRLDMGLARAYLLSHPDHVRRVLVDNHQNYWKGQVNHRAKFLFGNGLIANDGESWTRHRKMVQPAFHRRQLALIAEMMTRRIREVLDVWQERTADGTAIDLGREVEVLNMDLIIRAAFREGIEQAEVERMGSIVARALRQAQLRFFTFFLPDFVPLPGQRRIERELLEFDDVVFRLIAERHRTGAGEGDILSILLQSPDAETGEIMSDRQLRDEITTIFTAAGEAPALGIAWAWHLLAHHPEIEARLFAEVDTVLGDRPPTFQDLRQLEYTKRVYEEAMRLYPPVWMFFRQAYGADRLHDLELPEGAKVLLCPYVTHRSPRYWNDPQTFDPDRFLPENRTDRHPFAYFPFGSGRRTCIGNHFAMMEAQLILAMTAQRFRLRDEAGHVPEPMAASGLRSRNGIRMTLEPRVRATRAAPAAREAIFVSG